jgi:hypothetical protein
VLDEFACDWHGCPEDAGYVYYPQRRLPELAIKFCPKHRQTLYAVKGVREDLYRCATRLVRMSIEAPVEQPVR